MHARTHVIACLWRGLLLGLAPEIFLGLLSFGPVRSAPHPSIRFFKLGGFNPSSPGLKPPFALVVISGWCGGK